MTIRAVTLRPFRFSVFIGPEYCIFLPVVSELGKHEEFRRELQLRVSQGKAGGPKLRNLVKKVTRHLDQNSLPAEVQEWLQSKGFDAE